MHGVFIKLKMLNIYKKFQVAFPYDTDLKYECGKNDRRFENLIIEKRKSIEMYGLLQSVYIIKIYSHQFSKLVAKFVNR